MASTYSAGFPVKCFAVTTHLKCTIFELQTDRQTDRWHQCLVPPNHKASATKTILQVNTSYDLIINLNPPAHWKFHQPILLTISGLFFHHREIIYKLYRVDSEDRPAMEDFWRRSSWSASFLPAHTAIHITHTGWPGWVEQQINLAHGNWNSACWIKHSQIQLNIVSLSPV